ncbi:HNH endonuclease [Mycobacterium avium subsp. hominissuis]|uniref:Restriction endonuclease n=1 Tax=Mycobacterium avium TaxID=1764 RepID=A0A2A2ZAY0_MYCAV|nr:MULTISPECIES: HNH endonuclease [Mycobacteriaceae]MDO2386913.1 HNH endonuclease [Mycobacterium avium subsp. hominissuis]MDO2395373.1 HNH endonuclease [Mycobacterium avium subsp. hominissuis]PBA23601.1 restriction endonuclease [Mycobacterium avium]RUP28214.1 MAG: HNH endonuclease [Mycolicibacterium sp.]
MRQLRQRTNHRRQTVAVYNADYRVLTHVTWQEAVRLLLRGSVYVIERHSPAVHIHSPSTSIELPISVALREYVHLPHRHTNRVTREGVLQRDGYTCAYCGGYGDTLDHVLPESRGGQNTWLNLVAACGPCNGHKDNRTPAEAGMRLLWEPYEPRERDRYRVPAMA